MWDMPDDVLGLRSPASEARLRQLRSDCRELSALVPENISWCGVAALAFDAQLVALRARLAAVCLALEAVSLA